MSAVKCTSSNQPTDCRLTAVQCGASVIQHDVCSLMDIGPVIHWSQTQTFYWIGSGFETSHPLNVELAMC